MAYPTLAILRTELDADPNALGYAALKVLSNGPEAVAAKINDPAANGGATLFKGFTAIEDVLACVIAAEYTALSAANKALWTDLVVRAPRIISGNANMRATIAGIFAAGTTSRANLVAVASRPASRAETLWGEGIRISATDVSLAYELP
jgi:hypothetical protein